MDLRTAFIDMEHGADFALESLGLSEENGLETAVILSLFTDARASEDDELPPNETDRRGWWGDAFPETEGDRIGSRLWLLHRSKQLPEVVAKAREYATEALAWLVSDGIATAVNVDAWIVRDGVLGLKAEIVKPDASKLDYRYQVLWN